MKHNIILPGVFVFLVVFFVACSNSDEELAKSDITIGEEILQEEVLELTAEQKASNAIEELLSGSGYEILGGIKHIDLFSYLSGYYKGGHAFPTIFFDPNKKYFTVIGYEHKKSFSLAKIDDALLFYQVLLKQSGYLLSDEPVDSSDYIEINGQQYVYVELNELLPDREGMEKYVTPEQGDFLYNSLRPSQGYLFLSGYGNTMHNYPLMYAHDYKPSYLSIYGKDIMVELPLDSFEIAFQQYKEYITNNYK